MSESHVRKEQKEYGAYAPAVGAALEMIGQALVDGGLERELTELMKLRASQINGCAYCIQYHLNILRELGVPAEKLDLLVVWPEVDFYTEREQAALGWTELVNDIAHGPISDEAYEMIHEEFSEQEVYLLTAAIIEINGYNRFGAVYRASPPIPKHR